MLYRRKRRESIIIELSPLIDVVFLLLIFFMVSTRFKDDQGLDLALPSSESRQEAKSENLTIAVGRDKSLQVDGQAVALEGLQEQLGTMLGNRESKIVVLKIDKSVDHGTVVAVMDAARLAGAEAITLATAPKESR